MKRTSAVRTGILAVCPLLTLTGLLSLAATGPKEPKEPKAEPFPVNLFAQAKAEDYIPDATCARCHRKSHDSFQPSPHMPYVSDPSAPRDRQGCQSCHGPGGPHIAHLRDASTRYQYIISYTKATPMQAAAACLRCHQDTMTVAHWRRTGHAQGNVRCNDCHLLHQDPHNPEAVTRTGEKAWPLRGPTFPARPAPKKLLASDEGTTCGRCHQRVINEFRQNFHHPVPEGRMVCSDCHELHPRRADEKQTAARTRLRPVREMCVTCHGDMAGPFVYEHDPSAGLTGDGCMECHRPHGSQNPKLLTNFSRGLCNQCHTDKGINHHPGRSCWDSFCHVAVHGSNTDPLLLRR